MQLSWLARGSAKKTTLTLPTDVYGLELLFNNTVDYLEHLSPRNARLPNSTGFSASIEQKPLKSVR